jgi:hypothetical protein
VRRRLIESLTDATSARDDHTAGPGLGSTVWVVPVQSPSTQSGPDDVPNVSECV